MNGNIIQYITPFQLCWLIKVVLLVYINFEWYCVVMDGGLLTLPLYCMVTAAGCGSVQDTTADLLVTSPTFTPDGAVGGSGDNDKRVAQH